MPQKVSKNNMLNIWRIQPVYATVLEILREKGSMSDEKLFEILKVFLRGIGWDDFNNTLMKMEVTCLISVSSLLKDKRLVQLTKPKNKKEDC